MSKDLTRDSKFLSRILRHHPESIGLTLDGHGWAGVDDLVAGIAKTREFDRTILEEIVRTDEKQRYSFSADGRLIRANHGHSVPVDLELPPTEPPKYLWHGTAEKSVASIERQGLLPMSRAYVHLSADPETAKNVGKRHGKPVLYRVQAKKAWMNGIEFFLSGSGIWLTKAVPVEYLEKTEISD